jgi:hypothetical protein
MVDGGRLPMIFRQLRGHDGGRLGEGMTMVATAQSIASLVDVGVRPEVLRRR